MTLPPSVAFLARYGLHTILTDADNPGLWAAVVEAHWPAVEDPSLNVPGLSFGFHGFYEAPWTFEPAGGGALRAVGPEELDRNRLGPRPYPSLSIRIERPSAGKDRAFVDAGRTFAPLAGRGDTRVWERVPDADETTGAAWRPTEEVVTSWVS